MTVVIQEPHLMELELAVSSLLVQLSGIDVTRDINCQGPQTEHVKPLGDGLEIMLNVKVSVVQKTNISFNNVTFWVNITLR